MRSSADDLWARVRRQRPELADRVEALALAELDATSRCAGWRVRDVLGHLVFLAESTQASMARALTTGGFAVHSMLARPGRRLGALSCDDLVARLRAGADGDFHIVGTPRRGARRAPCPRP